MKWIFIFAGVYLALLVVSISSFPALFGIITFPGILIVKALGFIHPYFRPTDCSMDFFVQPSWCANAPNAIGFFPYLGLTALLSFIVYFLLGKFVSMFMK